MLVQPTGSECYVFDVLTSCLSPWCGRTIYTLGNTLVTDCYYITTWMVPRSECEAVGLQQWINLSEKLHGIRTRNVKVDKAAVVLHVEKWRPDGVSHAQNDIYLKTTSLALVDQGNLNCDLTANVATNSSTQQEISWNKKKSYRKR